jgi:hypothetical protein
VRSLTAAAGTVRRTDPAGCRNCLPLGSIPEVAGPGNVVRAMMDVLLSDLLPGGIALSWRLAWRFGAMAVQLGGLPRGVGTGRHRGR